MSDNLTQSGIPTSQNNLAAAALAKKELELEPAENSKTKKGKSGYISLFASGDATISLCSFQFSFAAIVNWFKKG